MECPDCGCESTKVENTREPEPAKVRRRRRCPNCGNKFTTYEKYAWDTLQVRKRDGDLEPFSTGKLRAGIERAVEKRPVTDSEVDEIVQTIEDEVKTPETEIVPSQILGELVSNQLRDRDPIAYIRFVSVYESFSQPEEFLEELDDILEQEGVTTSSDAGAVPGEPQ